MQSAIQFTSDPLCYPQLVNDLFEPELTFAQRLAAHIKFCVNEVRDDAEDPQQIIVY